jgi:hypothetical protein
MMMVGLICLLLRTADVRTAGASIHPAQALSERGCERRDRHSLLVLRQDAEGDSLDCRRLYASLAVLFLE